MRQAIMKMVVGLCAVCVVPARGEDGGPPAAGEPPIARARRLIEAGDRGAAVDLLEDALIDGPAGDRPAILDLLRRSYEAMARDADDAGRSADAAHYRDNLSILERARRAEGPAPSPQPLKPSAPPAKPAARPPAPRVEPAPARAPATTRPESASPPAAQTVPPPPTAVPPSALAGPPELRAPTPDPSVAEPSALPEPAKLPMPRPVKPVAPAAATPGMTRVPPVAARDDGTREIPSDSPMSAPAAAHSDESGDGAALVNPGEASRPEATRTEAEGRPAGAPGLAEADALFRARRYDESGRIYAALAAGKRLPDGRRPHWAYCRMVAVVRRINARPRSAREWDHIEAEIRDIQRLTPGNWFAEYLINKVAEARRTRRRPSAPANGLVVRGSAPDDPSPQVEPQPQPQAPRGDDSWAGLAGCPRPRSSRATPPTVRRARPRPRPAGTPARS